MLTPGQVCPPDHVWEGVQPGVIQDEATVEGTDQAGLLVARGKAVGGVGAGGQELQLQLWGEGDDDQEDWQRDPGYTFGSGDGTGSGHSGPTFAVK